jgi:hypothetical protein
MCFVIIDNVRVELYLYWNDVNRIGLSTHFIETCQIISEM